MRKYILIAIILLGFYYLNGFDVTPSKSLVINDKILESSNYSIGEFELSYDQLLKRFYITNFQDPNKVIWRNLDGKSFIRSANTNLNVNEDHGSFFFEEKKSIIYDNQTVEDIKIIDDSLYLRGHLFYDSVNQIDYSLKFYPKSSNQLGFLLKVDSNYCNQSSMIYFSDPDEKIYGFGEQFTHNNMKGKKVPVFVSEQGIGRGKQPITFLVDMVANSGGNAFTSYAPVPHYISTNLVSVYLKNTEYSIFDFEKDASIQIDVFSHSIEGGMILGSEPKSIITDYTKFSGRMKPLPDWVNNGAIIGMQGGTERVFEIVTRLKKNDVEIAAVWLQDWVGQRITSFGKQLWWNWELDTDHYHHWDSLKIFLDEQDIRVLTYTNPFLTDVKEKNNYRINYFDIAKDKSYFVNNSEGVPYDLDITTFSASLLDFTNPEVREWYKNIIKTNMLSLGIDGWMADFGEALPYDSKLHNGGVGAIYHNKFPEIWSQLNQEIVDESDKDLVYFCRSGYSKSPGYTSMFWLGDQLTSWDQYDGIKTAISGLTSSGLSGYSINHSDVGGYTAINTLFLKYIRSQELLMRWAEINVFTAVLRTHEGNRPDDNHQVYSDEVTMNHFSKMSRIYKALGFYRSQLMDEAYKTGLPLVRHPFILYPENINFLEGAKYQFFLGDEFLIAPITDEGQAAIRLYLPEGKWIHLWSQKKYDIDQDGRFISVDAPIGEPAVFYKQGSDIGQKFLKNLIRMDVINNH